MREIAFMPFEIHCGKPQTCQLFDKRHAVNSIVSNHFVVEIVSHECVNKTTCVTKFLHTQTKV